MDPQFSRDPWREVRRAPAWLAFATAWIVLLSGLAHLYHGAGRVVWLAGAGLVLAACVFGLALLRSKARDRQARLAGRTLLLWALGLITVLIAAAL